MEMFGGPYHCQGFEFANFIVAFVLLQCSAGIGNRSVTGNSFIALLLGQDCTKSHSREASVSRVKGSSKFGNASIGGLNNNSVSLSVLLDRTKSR